MKGFSYNIDTKTDLSTGDIFQTLTQEFNDIRTTLIRDVLKTKEEQTRDALISLGWTPPILDSSKCIVHGCQNHSHEGIFVGNMCGPFKPILNMKNQIGEPIPDKIEFESPWSGNGPTECGIVVCEDCNNRSFAIYDGGGTSGCAGGLFILKCLSCGHQQVLLDDEA